MHRELEVGDRSVSPVIGVVLMVGITVILMAVVGAFFLGYNYGTQDPPDSSFDYYVDSGGDLVIVHTGRQTFTADNTESVVVYVDGSATSSASPDFAPGDTITAGSVSEGDRVRVVWNAADGNQASTLLSFNAPAPP